jgi:hypothetical protein
MSMRLALGSDGEERWTARASITCFPPIGRGEALVCHSSEVEVIETERRIRRGPWKLAAARSQRRGSAMECGWAAVESGKLGPSAVGGWRAGSDERLGRRQHWGLLPPSVIEVRLEERGPPQQLEVPLSARVARIESGNWRRNCVRRLRRGHHCRGRDTWEDWFISKMYGI